MHFVLIVFHLIVTLILIGLILLQKGEDGGAAGGGATNPLFSTRASKNGLTMATSILATIFFLNCIVLAILIRNESRLSQSISTPIPADVQAPSPADVQTPAPGAVDILSPIAMDAPSPSTASNPYQKQ